MHAEKSGLAEYLAEDDLDGIRIAREVMSHLNWDKEGNNPRFEIAPPKYNQEDLLGIIEPSLKTPFDIREIIGRISDGSKFEEFKPLFGPTIICGLFPFMDTQLACLEITVCFFLMLLKKQPTYSTM